MIDRIALLLLIIGGINWGLVGKEHLHHSYKTTEIYKGIYRQGRIFHHKLFQRGL